MTAEVLTHPASDPVALLKRAATLQLDESILPEYRDKRPEEEGVGIAVAHLYQWDGLRIMRAFFYALEDANYHTEAGIVAEWIEAEGQAVEL